MREREKRYTRAVGAWLGCVIAAGAMIWPSTGSAKEILFVARDLDDQQAVWLPRDIILQPSTDFTEPLIFRFDNPTARTHVFEAPGLWESVEEGGLRISRPIRITIAPDETEQIVVDRSRITSDALTEGKPVTYRFYCPLHRADDDMGGSITVMK